MKRDQKQKTYTIEAWVELGISTEIKAFTREGAVRKAKQMEEDGTINWESGNWGALTIEGAKPQCERCNRAFTPPHEGYEGYCSRCVEETEKKLTMKEKIDQGVTMVHKEMEKEIQGTVRKVATTVGILTSREKMRSLVDCGECANMDEARIYLVDMGEL